MQIIAIHINDILTYMKNFWISWISEICKKNSLNWKLIQYQFLNNGYVTEKVNLILGAELYYKKKLGIDVYKYIIYQRFLIFNVFQIAQGRAERPNWQRQTTVLYTFILNI